MSSVRKKKNHPEEQLLSSSTIVCFIKIPLSCLVYIITLLCDVSQRLLLSFLLGPWCPAWFTPLLALQTHFVPFSPVCLSVTMKASFSLPKICIPSYPSPFACADHLSLCAVLSHQPPTATVSFCKCSHLYILILRSTAAAPLYSAVCELLDYSPPGSSVHGVFQTRILESVVISYSRGSSWPKDWTHISCVSCISR